MIEAFPAVAQAIGLRRARVIIPLLGLAALLAAHPVSAEVATVRIAQQFGISYLPLTIMKERGLLEEAAEKRGLKPPKVEWERFSGAAAMNDTLLSGNLDFASAGVAPMITIWDKTRRGVRVQGVASLGSMPNVLTTSRSDLKTLGDLTERDRIALPAAKVGFQAVVLQMAAEQAFGPGQQARLDNLTVSMPHPEATTAMLSGGSEITAHFTSPPFQEQQLRDPRLHKVLSSYDVLGGAHTFNVVYATGRFHDANPQTAAAFIEALDRAMALINGDPSGAARSYIEAEHAKLPPALVEAMIRAEDTIFTIGPQATLKFAAFMARTGAIKEAPADWRELFFREIHGRDGS